ncbi:MAG: arylsulfatase A-like enzyme [Candidatus Latescibacterota bacterium]|jgi:arylsulfatase A-like enzyme
MLAIPIFARQRWIAWRKKGRAFAGNTPIVRCVRHRAERSSQGAMRTAARFPVFARPTQATAPSTATVLKDQGYRTAYFGKWHCGIVHDQVPESAWGQSGARHRTPEHLRAGFEDWFVFEVINDHYHTSIYEGDAIEPTPLPGYQTDALTDRAIDYLQTYDRDAPCCCLTSSRIHTNSIT